MQTLKETLPTALNQAKANAHAPQSLNQPKTSVTLIEDANGRKELSNFLFQCFDALKVYGKEPEQMANVNSMFQVVLADYSFDQIKAAFGFYLKHHSELPAPADIANIIERGNKPMFKESVYVQFSKKQPCDRTREEWQYMREYEHFQMTGSHKTIPHDPKRSNIKTLLGGGHIQFPDGRIESPTGEVVTSMEYTRRMQAATDGTEW